MNHKFKCNKCGFTECVDENVQGFWCPVCEGGILEEINGGSPDCLENVDE